MTDEESMRRPIHCDRCGCVSSTVRRDHDNVARCDVCYGEEYKGRGAREQTDAQAKSIRTIIRRSGVPLREEWAGEDFHLSFKVGLRRFGYLICPDGRAVRCAS